MILIYTSSDLTFQCNDNNSLLKMYFEEHYANYNHALYIKWLYLVLNKYCASLD